MTNLITLASVQAYDNEFVVKLFTDEHPEILKETAQQIFSDLLGWLWLSNLRSQRQLTTHMITPLAHLDKMWHCFISRSEDYKNFCEKYFNRYLQHVVLAADDYVMSADELSEYLSDCYDQLGEGWVLRNFIS